MVSENSRLTQAYWELMTQEEREQYAWLAGIIDGEGNISIHWHGGGYQLLLRIVMTTEITIDKIQKITGLFTKRLVKKQPPRRDQYRWQITGQKAASVLRHCLPFLVTKREQALCAIEFTNLQKLANLSRARDIPGSGSAPLSPGFEEKLLELHEFVKELNKRGVEKTPVRS